MNRNLLIIVASLTMLLGCNNASSDEIAAQQAIENAAHRLGLSESANKTNVTTKLTTIPQRFQGRYSATLERCADPDNDESLLTIGDSQVSYHDTSRRVLYVLSNHPNRISVELPTSQSKENWQTELYFELLPDGSLSDMARGRDVMTRVRCS